MKGIEIKKLCFAALFIALGVVCSSFSIPVGASRCLPTQHAVNVIAGVMLGPGYACIMAFLTSLIRVLLGTGSLLAFPGSMVGALVCGFAFRYGKKIWHAVAGEMAGTGLLGALAAYPVAVLLMGADAAVFTYVIPFLISTVGGSLISALLLKGLQKSHVLGIIQNGLSSTVQKHTESY